MGKNHKKKQPVSVLLAAQRQPVPQSASALARQPREILRVVAEHLYHGEQLRTLANLASTCRRLEIVIKPFLNSRVSWGEQSWAVERKGLNGDIPEHWKHIRYVFLTGQGINCDWWWHDLARLAPECKTRDAITHHFFPSIQYVAESREAKGIKFPYTLWLSTRNVTRFDAAYMKVLIAAVGRMHQKRGGKMKGFAEDRMPAFHSNFEPDTPSPRVEHMVAQLNKITSMMSRTPTAAGPVPSEMNTPSIIRTDAIIYLEPSIKMDILFLDDPSGKSSRLGRLQRIVELFFALVEMFIEKRINKPILLSIENHDFANFEGWIQAITSCAVNAIPFSHYTLVLALSHKMCPTRFEDEMLNFYCETVLPIWQNGATRHLLPNTITIEANTFPGSLDADLREAHIRFNPKNPLDGVFVSIVQWSSPTAPPPGQPDSTYARMIHCHSREVIKDGHTEIKPKPKEKKPKRRAMYKTLLLS